MSSGINNEQQFIIWFQIFPHWMSEHRTGIHISSDKISTHQTLWRGELVGVDLYIFQFIENSANIFEFHENSNSLRWWHVVESHTQTLSHHTATGLIHSILPVIDHHVDDTVDSGLTKIDRKFPSTFLLSLSSPNAVLLCSSHAIISILDFSEIFLSCFRGILVFSLIAMSSFMWHQMLVKLWWTSHKSTSTLCVSRYTV